MKRKIKTSRSEYYNVRSILGNQWAIFYIILGGRGAGKTFSVMDYFLSQFFKSNKMKPFIWIRLTEASTRKLLQNNAMELIDVKLREKYDLNEKLTTRGHTVFYTDDDGKKYELCKVLALSTFYADKGVAHFKDVKLDDHFVSYNIAVDEFQRERNEKNTFDICYAFVNQLENIVRHRTDVRIFLIGNTLEEASDILTMFGFIPVEFGRYKLKSKKAVIDYIQHSSKYLERRKDSIASILAADESTFTNQLKMDYTLIWKKRCIKPSYIIKFDQKPDTWFTVWDGRVVRPYHKEKVESIYMKPLTGGVFSKEAAEQILLTVYLRGYCYSNLFTQKNFEKQIKLYKGLK